MTAKTHIMGGILAGELAAWAVNISGFPVLDMVAGAAVGGLLPDIDHPRARISTRSALGYTMSMIACKLTTHRGPIHTPAFIFLCALFFKTPGLFVANEDAFVFPFGLPVGPLGLLVGMLSHIILDSFNPYGIMWLWPIKKNRFHFGNLRSGSPLEWLIVLVLFLACAFASAPFL